MDGDSAARPHRQGQSARRAARGDGNGGAVDDPAAADSEARPPPAVGPRLALIAAKEERTAALTDEELRARTADLRARLLEGVKARIG